MRWGQRTPAPRCSLRPALVATVAFMALACSAVLPWTHGVRAPLTVLLTQVVVAAVVVSRTGYGGGTDTEADP